MKIILQINTIIGIVASATSIINLLQEKLNLTLIPSFKDFLEFYRESIRPLMEFLEVPIVWVLEKMSIAAPNWLPDAHILSFAAAAVFFKSFAKSGIREKSDVKASKEINYIHLYVLIFFAGFLLFGLMHLVLIIYSMVIFPFNFIDYSKLLSLKKGIIRKPSDQEIKFLGGDLPIFYTSPIFGWATVFAIVLFYIMNWVL